MSQITSHILDTALGKPAAGVPVVLGWKAPAGWEVLANASTDADGRISNWLTKDRVLPGGEYRLEFETGAYFKNQGLTSFFPRVSIHFQIEDGGQHYHVPLLLSPFGYSTYRGS